MNEDGIPVTISVRTEQFKPLLEKWRRRHQGVPWGILLRRALRKELKPLAGKRLAHLVDERVVGL